MSDNDFVINGVANISNQSFESLTINGAANLENIIVKKNLHVSGTLALEDSTVGNIVAHGRASIEDSTIIGSIDVYGKASFEDSDLEQVKITAQKVQFEDCKIETIIMASRTWWIFPRTRTVILEDTRVFGDIVFEEEKGVVILKGSSVIEGTVVNGTSKQGWFWF